jgi:hypothetical protein
MRSRLCVYEPNEAAGSLGSITTTWTLRERLWGEFMGPTLRMRTYGAGELPDGAAVVRVHPNARVQPRDGVEVAGGPMKGTRWRVDGEPDRSDHRSTLVRMIPYNGPAFEG